MIARCPFFLALALLSACGSSRISHDVDASDDAGTVDADLDAPPATDLGAADGATDLGARDLGPPDLGPPDLGAPADLGPGLELHLESPMLWTCNCHHGCGPGIDGSFSLVVTNTGAAPVLVEVLDVVLTPAAGTSGPFSASTSGHFTVMGAAAGHMLTVAGASVLTSTVTPYIDLAFTMPGDYRIDVPLRVNGTPVTVSIDTFVPTMTTAGCP